MYGCESWTVKKAECRRIDAFELWCWRRLLRVPWTARRSKQSILKEINPEYSLEGWSWCSNTLDSWCEELTHWKRPWCWERLRGQEEKGVTENEMVGWYHWLNGHEFGELWELVMPSNHLILCHPLLLLPSQSFPASGSFQMSQLFTSVGQSIRVSALTSVLPMYTQDWSPLEWTGWISLQSKGLSRVFSNTTVQKHEFFGTQLSSQSSSHIHTWPLEKPQPWLDGPL